MGAMTQDIYNDAVEVCRLFLEWHEHIMLDDIDDPDQIRERNRLFNRLQSKAVKVVTSERVEVEG